MIIEFGEFRSELLILLIYNVGIFCAKLLGPHDTLSSPIYYLFIFFISHFFAVIPMVISKKKMEIQTESNKIEDTRITSLSEYFKDKNSNSITVFAENMDKERRFYIILNFIIIASFYFLTYGFFYYYNYILPTTFYGSISMVSEIFYFSLFDVLILKTHISKHHYFGMIIITVSILALYVILNINQFKEADIMNSIVIPNLANLVAYCPFCFYLVLSKQFMEKYFISPYEFIFYLGIFGTAVLVLLEPFTFLIPCHLDNVVCNDGHFGNIIYGFRKNFVSPVYILNFIGEMITLFLTALGLWLTVKFLSPSHFITTDSIVTFSLNILFDILLNNYFLCKNPWFYIFSFTSLIGCLIYNEIIILRFCGLEYNTRKEINRREKKDILNDDDKTDTNSEVSENEDIGLNSNSQDKERKSSQPKINEK